MKKGIILLLLAFSGFTLYGCSSNETSTSAPPKVAESNSNEAKTTDTTKADATKTDSAKETKTEKPSKKETEPKKDSNTKDSSVTETNKTKTSDSSSKETKSSTKTDKSESKTTNSKTSEKKSSNTKNTTLSLNNLAEKICKKDLGDFKYITPVKVTKSGDKFKATKDSNSTVFYCSDEPLNPSDISKGCLIQLLKTGDDTYQYNAKLVKAIENGGHGNISRGTITSNGVISE